MTRWIGSIILILGTLLCVPTRVAAQSKTDPTLSATYAFGDAVRAGSWTPIIVSVTDPLSRNLDLVIEAATGSPIGASIHVPITTYGTSTSYTVYLPTTSGFGFSNVSIQLCDPLTGRKIGPSHAVAPNTNYWEQGVTFAIVMSNTQSMFVAANYDKATTSIPTGFLSPADLPPDRIGYDGIDVMMLYGVDLDRIDAQVQRSIIAWVEGGGRLIVWPGDHLQNENAPLAKILPAKIGAIDSFNVALANADYKSSLGANTVLARSLTRIGLAEPVEFHDKFPPSIQADYGLGRICLLPVDVFDVRTGKAETDRSFSIDVLKGMVRFKKPYESSAQLSPRLYLDQDQSDQGWNSISDGRSEVLGKLANVANLKTFDLSLLLWMMLALTILVGPVDWFVLRALKRQPWTWFTTLGWAGVAAIGATMLAFTGRGGASTFRSLTIIDQFDGRTIAKSQLACLYSSQTRKFEIEQNSPTWWRIPWDGNFPSRGRSGSFIDFRQSAQSNSLLPFTIRQWNVLVLESETFGNDPSKLDQKFSFQDEQHKRTFHNGSPWPVRSLLVMSSEGAIHYERTIAPGESFDLSGGKSLDRQQAREQWPELNLDPQGDRDMRNAVDRFPDAVVFLARLENYDGPKLADNTNIEEHHSAVVRGVVRGLPVIHLDGIDDE